jgi:hypothetical protein
MGHGLSQVHHDRLRPVECSLLNEGNEMTQTPAGWHPDPQNPGQLRYWDGNQWTEHRAPGSQQPATPLTLNPKPPASPSSKRTIWLALGGVALLVGGCAIGAAAAGSGDDGGTNSASSTSTVTVTAKPSESAAATITATVTAAPTDEASAKESSSESADDVPASNDGTKPSLAFPKQNGDWRLDSLQVKDDGLGDFGAVGRITYTGEDESGGANLFTVTLFNNDGDIVATLTGSASDVKPGQTVTTQFVGSDPYKSGKFPSTFQKDF